MNKYFLKWYISISKNIRNKILQWTNALVIFLSRIELKLNRNENPNPNGYEDLTPTSKGDEDKKYSSVLEWALKNANIKNIALTGSYGSGKSSIIKAFIKEHRGYNILNISLASFSDIDIPEKGDEINRLIELSILQQMFYKVRHKDIPDSRFQRIRSLGLIHIISKSFLFSVWLLAIFIFLKSKFITDSFLWKEFDLSSSNIISVASSILFILGIVYIATKIIRVFNNSKLNKLNVQSGAIEISNEVDSSILNKHLDEILYFFEVTHFDIVVLEDLDRFKNTEIFTKLRELNILINNSRQINRRIVFLYAIKDDMFLDKNRTKFFDFIIPVIPIINTSNSGEMFLNKLKEAKFVENAESVDSLSLDFINDVSLYIDDMRLLKNIYNEYVVYKEKLDPKLNQDNLLAMIIYKNIFPSDFVDLHNDRGIVYSVFNKKSELIQSSLSEINSRIKDALEEIKLIENTRTKDTIELRAIYIEKIIETIPNIVSMQINGKNLTFANCKTNDSFKFLLQNNSIIYYVVTNISYSPPLLKSEQSSVKFSEIEKAVDPEMSYSRREELIFERDNGKIEKLRLEIEQLKKNKQDVKSWSLVQLSEKIDHSIVFNEIENEKLIIYLIKNGYLNENYHDYISFFYAGLISKEDRDFLFSIKNRDALDFKFKLSKTDNLIKKIRLKEFEYKETLNCCLLDLLLIKRATYIEQFNSLFSQICNKSSSSLLFIDCYISVGLNMELFVKELHLNWYDFWQYIVIESGYSDEKKDIYLNLILTYLEIEGIKNQNVAGSLSNYISTKKDFISYFSEINDKKVKSILDVLNIKFSNLEYPVNESSVFDYIYENNHYQVNKELINLILQKKGNIENISQTEVANYTSISSSNCKLLIKYVNENIQDYITNVFLQLPNNTQESEESIIFLLNNEDIDIESRQEIIDVSDHKISSLSNILNIGIKAYLISFSKTKANWDNIIHYYSIVEEKFDDNLIDFLEDEENYIQLSDSKIKDCIDLDKKLLVKFSNSFISNEKISDKCFEALLLCCPYVYSSLDFEKLSMKKIELMIKHGYIQLSRDSYYYLKEKFAGKQTDLLFRNAQIFLKTDEEYAFDENDLLTIIGSNVFNVEQKTTIVLSADKNLIMQSSRLCSIVCDILSRYQYVELDFDLLFKIILKSQSIENKIKLLNIHYQYLSHDSISELLPALGEPYSDISVKGKQPSIPNSKTNLLFAEKLDKSNYISSIKVKKDKIKINTYKN